MPTLHPELRKLLERTVIKARQIAEEGATTVLKSLAVDKDDPFATLSETQREQRRRLRAEERRLGGFNTLVSEVAYETWHSRLFARFLLENNLLIYEGFPVSPEDLHDEEVQHQCKVASPEALATVLAAKMLPGLFEPQDPSWRIVLPPEYSGQLEKLLNDLPKPVFEADDSLGWVYQFWQSAEKVKVNEKAKGGHRIAAKDVSAVTQLFTEPYMVDWLLDQALDPLLQDSERDLSQLKILDPSGGSGHFLVSAFGRVVKARMEREGLSAAEAGNRVLAENLYGLELDPRCVQLAGFNLMFVAWKHGGYRELPLPNMACSGLPAGGSVREWQALASDDETLQSAMIRLFDLFAQAPILGSLLDPREQAIHLNWSVVEPALEKALEKFSRDDDPVAAILGGGARGLMRATKILSQKYDLVITNVPYLARGKHNPQLAEFCAKNYSAAKNDLATVFIDRCLRFCNAGGYAALVTPQNWLFLGAYKAMRERLLRSVTWKAMARLGAGAFTTISGEVVNVALFVFQSCKPLADTKVTGWDVSKVKFPEDKAAELVTSNPVEIEQLGQLKNPDNRIILESLGSGKKLGDFAGCYSGLVGGDISRFVFNFWELPKVSGGWEFMQNSFTGAPMYGGMSDIIFWEGGRGRYYQFVVDKHGVGGVGVWIRGQIAWNRAGVAMVKMQDLATTLYNGDKFGANIYTIVPHKTEHLAAIFTYTRSPEFLRNCRLIDQKIDIANHAVLKVPFDLEKWQRIADEKYPEGLPQPFSDDPTQWLFDGHPQTARARGGSEVLQIAMARLLGYHWPQQEADAIDALADADGIVPLVPVSGEVACHERLRILLEAALDDFSPGVLESLLGDAGYGGKTLENYLRNGFFAAHCKLFHNRPFLWHIWDGRADGFGAIVNYHKLDHARLEKLIYTYLGDYIKNQREADKEGTPGAGARLAAAEALQKKLTAILEGEAPYDIYVRWKKLQEQPIGWNPDLNDGVRLNVRPFFEAGVLRSKFTIHWKTDRGKNPDGSDRINDIHLTPEEKRAAQKKAGLPE